MTLRWLASPVVTLISFLASVATLGHLAAAAGRGACRVAQDAEDKRRGGLALVLLAAAAISMPLTWQPIVAEVSKLGEGGAIGEIYPATMTGAAVAGALVLLQAAMTGRRAPLAAWLITGGGFAMTALTVAIHGGLALPA
jgi:hypothetical protein